VTTHISVDADHSEKNALPQAPDLLRDLPRQVVPIGDLMGTLSPRERHEDPAHVRLLAETESTHPLLVHRPTMRVIDGVHRLLAAMMNGRTEVAVQSFDGSEADAFVLAVELNIRHGLPLTLRERKAAAQRIIGSHANWSDRAIAERTGLSAKTVGKTRKEATDEVPERGSRVGRDGKARPLSSVEGRRSAAALIVAEPEISLRELSRKTGVSVGTIRNVRKRLACGQDPIPDRLRDAESGPARVAPPHARTMLARGKVGAAAQRAKAGWPRGEQGETASVVRKLLRDPSLRATESGRRLLRMLVATELERSELEEIATAVPAHCVPLVRAVALARSEEWDQLARMV
jgi:ParB-like chromosome segregation protein Spo0J